MAFNVSYNFIAVDKFSRIGQKIKNTAAQISRKVNGMGEEFRKTIPKIDRFKKKITDLSRTARSFGASLFTRATLPIAALGGAALFQSAKLETLEVSFETMLGSAEKAKKLMEDLVRFTATTPFQLEGVAQATKTLLAFKVEQEEMIPTLRMLGDIAAATDAPISDIAQIFGKAKAKGKLMTEELLQLAERGIPIIQDLSDHFNVLPSDVFEAASKSQISFAVMEQSLQRLTSEGGIFFDQTSKQSKTLAGLWSTFMDNLKLSLAAFGDMNVEVFNLKGLLERLIAPMAELPAKITRFTEQNPELARMVTIFIGIVAALGPLLIAIGVLGLTIPFVITGFKLLGAAVLIFARGILLLISPIGLWTAAIAAAVFFTIKHWDKIKEVTSALVDAMKVKFTEFKDFVTGIFDTIKENTVGVLAGIGEKIGGHGHRIA